MILKHGACIESDEEYPWDEISLETEHPPGQNFPETEHPPAESFPETQDSVSGADILADVLKMVDALRECELLYSEPEVVHGRTGTSQSDYPTTLDRTST